MERKLAQFRRCLVFATMVGFGVSSSWINAKSGAANAIAGSGFVSIFNGKDLSDWDGDPRFWSVKDGVIRGQTTADMPTDGNTFCIWRGGKCKNFALKLKFRIQNGNSGIQYRSTDLGDWRVAGYQSEVANDRPDPQIGAGFLYHERGRGQLTYVGDFVVIDEMGNQQILRKIAERQTLMEMGYYRNKEWNECRIVARGNHLAHYINGYQVIELIDNDPKGRSLEGILALQIHSGPPMTVEFKDIQIEHLPDHFGEAIRLFNGQDLKGWTFSSDELKDTWSVKDGVLINRGQPTGYIRTVTDYANFILRLQFRHLTKGNGGVLMRMVGTDRVWPRAIEAQGQFGSVGDIWNIDQFPMKTDPQRTTGAHTAKIHDSNEKLLGEWNQYEIKLHGPELEIKVNELVQNTASDCWETPGKICLQSEGGRMEFRNIVLIPIHRSD